MINPKTFRRLLGVLTSLLFVILLSQIVGGFSNQSAESKGELNNLLPISNQPLQIGGVLSADVVEIGEIVTLTMAVRNNQTDAATPKLTIQLPPSLQLEMSKLGDNMLFNPKEQTLYWYPELNQSGDMAVQDVSLIALRPTKNSEDVGAILLQISDKQDGFTNQLDLPIWVGHSIKPAALFEVTDQAAGVGQIIRFTNQSAGQPPLTFVWDFGDGQTTTAAEPIHTYAAQGNYIVTLSVIGKQGEASYTLPIQVGIAPQIELMIQERIEAGSSFVAQGVIDSHASSISWEMGDGIAKDGFWIEHTYATPGEYLLTVNVTNEFGNSVLSKRVSVLPAVDPPILSSNPQIAPVNGSIEKKIEGAASPTPDFLDMEIDIRLEADPELDNLILTDQLRGYINAAREMVGLHRLEHSYQLNLAAQAHTDEAAFGTVNVHIGADGSTPYDRVEKTNYVEGFLVGEATAWGFNSARAAVQFWLDSPDHRPLLFNHEVDQVGVGQSTNYDTTYAWYWTAEFASYEIPTTALLYNGPAPILPATATAIPFATPIASLTTTSTPTASATYAATPIPTGVPTGRPVMTATISPSATAPLTPTESTPATLTPTVMPTETEQETGTPTLIVEPTAREESTAVPETETPTQIPAESPTPTPESTESAEAGHPAQLTPQLGEIL